MRIEKDQYDLVVIGGGPAGMMAAGTSAQKGLKVALLEKNSNLGEKLLLTGKGRCNLTNDKSIQEIVEAFGENGRFLYSTLTQFSNEDLKNFFEEKGLKLKLERGGRFFPQDDKSIAVLKILKSFLKQSGVEIFTHIEALKVSRSSQGFQVICQGKEKFSSQKLLIATGGKSYPGTGSTGDGYRFAQDLGHTITSLEPALVPLVCKNKAIRELQGLSLKNVKLSIYVDRKKKASLFGEMLFTHFGISGPIVLTLSNQVYKLLQENKKVVASIDFKPALDEEILDQRLRREFGENRKKGVAAVFKNLLPKKLVPVFMDRLKISEKTNCSEISREERSAILKELKGFRFQVSSTLPIEAGIVTAGGVKLAEINPKTLESKICPGLYFAGEVLDLNGPSGGYNLTCAFCTGFVAGKNI